MISTSSSSSSSSVPKTNPFAVKKKDDSTTPSETKRKSTWGFSKTGTNPFAKKTDDNAAKKVIKPFNFTPTQKKNSNQTPSSTAQNLLKNSPKFQFKSAENKKDGDDKPKPKLTNFSTISNQSNKPAFGNKMTSPFSKLTSFKTSSRFSTTDAPTSSSSPVTPKNTKSGAVFGIGKKSSTPEIKTVTGEENEIKIFKTNGTVRVFKLDKEKMKNEPSKSPYTEVGKGRLTINEDKDDNSQSRILIREEGTLKLKLNLQLFPEVLNGLAKVNEKSIRIVAYEYNINTKQFQPATFILRARSDDVVAIMKQITISAGRAKSLVASKNKNNDDINNNNKDFKDEGSSNGSTKTDDTNNNNESK
eukprot:TRINITY_DN2209_c0_g4_i4.p1 TRINITY_DN2209_c0_g4~~TRINITY_DN2209_c0_g4_i4.p1  ORF type:complete len:360 (-),score=165.16 TRINITY_DN2209_c0_g4_i4:17-1096(-)